METLEQYGIKDVTPGYSMAGSVRLRAVKGTGRGDYLLYVRDRYVGRIVGMVQCGWICDGDTLLSDSSGSSIWVEATEK